MIDTLGTLKAEIRDWLDEDLPDARMNNAVNDGIESLWSTLMHASVSIFMGGPLVLHFNNASNLVISVLDPVAAPTISNVASADTGKAAHLVRVAYTYITESGSETLASPVASFTTNTGALAAIHVPTQISGVFGWNCYVSNEAFGLLVLANDQPLGWDSYFYEPESGFDHDPNGPYPPDENTTGDDIAYIRHMEAQMPDEGFKAYDQVELHSLAMRRMGRAIATSNVYQNYAFDLINQRQVEIRPVPKLQIDARVFYIKRPRRLKFDSAPLPFLTFPSVGFLRDFALSKLSLSIREYETAKGWLELAEQERTRTTAAVLQISSPKNEFITPGI